MHWRLKRLVARLPQPVQRELRRMHYAHQIRNGRFGADEPEYEVLERWVAPGDWVLDVGANIGHYTLKLSELVGHSGRVIAVEPAPETFPLLAAHVLRCRHANVTLLNVAASDSFTTTGMTVPLDEAGLTNFYMARLDPNELRRRVLTVPIDSLRLPQRVSLVKIDVEGREVSALKGMRRIVAEDRPVFVVEDSSPEARLYLEGQGYRSERLPASPNVVYYPDSSRH